MFREDLFYRLKCSEIKLTPLRERPQDIIPLANHFLLQFSHRFNMELRKLSPEVEARLTKYYWAGNVRELRNVIESLVTGGDGPYILPSGLPFAGNELGVIPPSENCLTLYEAERLHILKVLELNNKQIKKTARALGITPKTLRAKLKHYRL
jgi:DNA-binding NtrC family response regulator